MNREQTRLIELLGEFDALCRENDIRYYLSGDTLKYAVSEGNTGPNDGYATVLMKGPDCRAFIDAFGKLSPADREIEYWGNTGTYPDYTIRYVASDTTVFDMVDYFDYRAHGMYIEIGVLRGYAGGGRAKAMTAFERGIAESASRVTPEDMLFEGRKGLLYKAYFRASQLFKGNANVRRTLFDYFSEECTRPTAKGNYTVYQNGRRLIGIPASLFEGDAGECEIDGHPFPIPHDWEYLSRRTRGKGPETFVIDVDRPYTEAIGSSGISDDDFMKLREADLKFVADEEGKRDDLARARHDWAVVQQTDARFRMWKEYMPKKGAIMKAHEAGDFDILREELKEYDEEMDELLTYEKSFSFDNDILEVYLDMLRHDGLDEKATEVMKFMPQSHLDESVRS